MTTHPGGDYDPFDETAQSFPKPGGGGPPQPIVDAAAAWEAWEAGRGWDLTPQLLWMCDQPLGGPVALSPVRMPQPLHGVGEHLLNSGKPYDAPRLFAQILAGLGSSASKYLPADVVAVALVSEAWGIRRPDEADPAELDHLKKLRDQRKLWTRPERMEMRYVNLVDVDGNECAVIRTRGTGGKPDNVEVQTWPASRANHYRGELVDAVRELARVVGRLRGTASPAPDFRTVFGLN